MLWSATWLAKQRTVFFLLRFLFWTSMILKKCGFTWLANKGRSSPFLDLFFGQARFKKKCIPSIYTTFRNVSLSEDSPWNYGVSVAGLNASVQSEVGDGGQLWFQQILLHNIQHALQLTEDENTVLGHHSLCATIRCSWRTQPTVQQELQTITLHI